MKTTLSKTEKLFLIIGFVGSMLSIFGVSSFILNNFFPLLENNFEILLFTSVGICLLVCADSFRRTNGFCGSKFYNIWSVVICPFLLQSIFCGFLFCRYKGGDESYPLYWILGFALLLFLLISGFVENKYGDCDD